MHERKRIRVKLQELLAVGIPIIGTTPTQYFRLDVGNRVFVNRRVAIETREIPCATLMFRDERAQWDSSVYMRTLPVDVSLFVLLRDKFDDELDRLSWQTEVILADLRPWNDTGVDDIRLTSTSPYNHVIEGEQHIGVSKLSFDISYIQEIHTPGTADDFLTAAGTIETASGASNEFNQSLEAP